MESTGPLFLDGEWESICSTLFTSEQHDTVDFSSPSFFLPQDAYNNGGGLLPLFNAQYSTDQSQSIFDNAIIQKELTTQLTPCSSNNNHLSQPSSSSVDTTATYETPLDLGYYFQNDQFHSLQPFMDFLSMDTIKDDDDDHDDGGSFFTFPPVCDKSAGAATNTNQATPPMIDGESAATGLNSHNAADELELIQPQQQHQVTPTPKKRIRVSKDGENGKRKVRVKKNKQPVLITEEDQKPGKTESSNTNNNVQQSSNSTDMIISDNESNAAVLEKSNDDGSETINGKKIRANRGAATDPQSLYARKRRERINERLRILQNLVPNGIKVDISTMLEEAVHYVKFLQLQIKLLSSDDMWMYAPLAYSGFDMGLYKSFSPYMMKPQGF